MGTSQHLSATLAAIDHSAHVIYGPALHRGLAGLPIPQHGQPSRILETGAGIGSLTELLTRYGQVIATDIDPQFIGQLKQRFAGQTLVQSELWDAGTAAPDCWGRVDAIVSFNVLEHLKDDRLSLRHWFSALNPGGRLVLLTPNNPKLFGKLDEALGHYRRYRRQELCELLESVGFEVKQSFFANALGVLGWYVAGKILRRRRVPQTDVRAYVWLKKAFRFCESWLDRRTGLSVVVIAEKPRHAQRSITKTYQPYTSCTTASVSGGRPGRYQNVHTT